MDLRQLEYFVVVAEEGSFTRAASRLHVVQSGVSATISALERDLRSRLFDRTSRRVALTDAGAVLLPRARATIAAARDARDAVDEVAGGTRGSLAIGTLSSLGPIDLPALLGRFHRQHPDVTVRLSTEASAVGSPGLMTALHEGRLDLAFVSVPGRTPLEVEVTPLASVPLELVVPLGHELSSREHVRLPDLAGQAFIDFPVGYGNRDVADRAFASAGVDRHVAIEISHIDAGAGYVRHGLGIALLPSTTTAHGALDDLVRVPIVGADLDWPISLARSRRHSLSAAARAFERVVRSSQDRQAATYAM